MNSVRWIPKSLKHPSPTNTKHELLKKPKTVIATVERISDSSILGRVLFDISVQEKDWNRMPSYSHLNPLPSLNPKDPVFEGNINDRLTTSKELLWIPLLRRLKLISVCADCLTDIPLTVK
jgi:hypothetical protein